jgi:hypothetical protein
VCSAPHDLDDVECLELYHIQSVVRKRRVVTVTVLALTNDFKFAK